jgi:hypothetical protein
MRITLLSNGPVGIPNIAVKDGGIDAYQYYFLSGGKPRSNGWPMGASVMLRTYRKQVLLPPLVLPERDEEHPRTPVYKRKAE